MVRFLGPTSPLHIVRPSSQDSRFNGKKEKEKVDNGQLRFAGVEPLDELSKDRGELGNLVNAFLDSQTSGSDNWLGKWFLSRTQKHYAESSSSTLPRPNSVPGSSDTSPIVRPMRLKSVRIHNFRGFRSETDEIDLEGKLSCHLRKKQFGKDEPG